MNVPHNISFDGFHQKYYGAMHQISFWLENVGTIADLSLSDETYI